MACNEYICEGYSLGLNRCSTGFVVYTNETQGTRLRAEIKVGESCFSVDSVVSCYGRVMFDWKPAEYLQSGNYELSLSLYKGRELITFPFEDTCTEVCGVDMIIRDDCYEGFVYINQECSIDAGYRWAIPFNECEYRFTVKDCDWTFNINTKMITQIKYGNSKIYLNNKVIVRNGALATINPLFEAELETIEAGAFLVTLVGSEAVISYIGTETVDFYDNCEILTKDCA